MRHMYDSDGNIPYAGKVRASNRWQPSQRPRRHNRRNRTNEDRPESKAAEVALDLRTHKERIRDILAASPSYRNDFTGM